MIEQRWRIRNEEFHCDAEGDGYGIYAIDIGSHRLTYVMRAFRWDGVEKVGRRSDGAIRDMFGAIFLGVPDRERINREIATFNLRDADRMRTDSSVNGWTPGSRSARFFDHVVDALAAGCHVLHVSTGAQAQAYLHTNEEAPLDLVLSDVAMPGGVSGVALARWIERAGVQARVGLWSSPRGKVGPYGDQRNYQHAEEERLLHRALTAGCGPVGLPSQSGRQCSVRRQWDA